MEAVRQHGRNTRFSPVRESQPAESPEDCPMKRLLIFAIGVLSLSGVCEAKKHQAVTSTGKEVVVHSNVAPVVIHRVLPPYGLGKHVYEKSTNRAK
jgi:hypothetical protein